ncbi:short-chain dehydrogenase/reductase family protein [Heterostelium album PN500]|uniref:Short-chain dehydrogenase/reductase family protein n=1 Tax=Heterostelium pallidum (strain ATCC 26659 / Pp 5 / PN500) TaxID=670386 RepID=D3AW97_HETP5|nr:short-chain dehydrogenase/reductase family protein [Heterostelium album PN500]EFA86570.1 short-chain dehydrogenase/reductase family protein [Heterostelium album PN500]|eukprot:XP_020438675.1 short-chain dehydrogenase/reductase family protein [Heterostelium album PN500]
MTTFSILGYIFFLLITPILYFIGLFNAKKFPDPRSILITGASSGIGKTLAINYAAKGKVLFLTGRNKERLEEVVSLCQRKGARVEYTTIDVTDREISEWIVDSDRKSPIDLVIANAGVTELVLPETMTYEEKLHRVNDVNVNGVLNTVMPLIPAFRERSTGQIVVTGSISYQVPLACPIYCATKSWVQCWCTSLRQELLPYGIGVTVLVPAFVRTPMSEAVPIANKPFEKTTDESVKIFMRDISSNKAFSCDNNAVLYLSSLFKVSPNLRDGWTFIQNKIYPEGNMDTYDYTSKKKNQ